MMTKRNNMEYIKVLLSSCYTTITGWGGVLLKYLYAGRQGAGRVTPREKAGAGHA